MNRRELRKTLREKRRALSESQQQWAAAQLLKNLRRCPVFLRSKHIAFYMPSDGEINPLLLITAAEKMGKCCYLPVLHPLKNGHLLFGKYRFGDELQYNHFGLLEPPAETSNFPLWALDLVLMPLVGFDRQGNRLGMGGGFYDRSFAFKQNNIRRPKTPTLIGLAHSCQEVDNLKTENWDIPLDYIYTEKNSY